MDLETLLEKLDIGESQDFECKTAESNFLKDAWKTISAFANTEGGYILPTSETTNLLSLLQNTSASQSSSDYLTANSDHLSENFDDLEKLKAIANRKI